jgi:hypothetical protein
LWIRHSGLGPGVLKYIHTHTHTHTHTHPRLREVLHLFLGHTFIECWTLFLSLNLFPPRLAVSFGLVFFYSISMVFLKNQ